MPLIVPLLVFSLVLLVGSSEAARAQTLPVVGKVMWRIPFLRGVPTGAVAYAPSADLVFAGAEIGEIYVVQGTSGVPVDTISIDNWRLTPDGRPLDNPCDLSCSRDGRVIAVTVRNDDVSKVVVLEYPSKRILLDSLYISTLSNEYIDYRITVSPSGRYVTVPNAGGGHVSRNGMRLFDLAADTSCVISNGSAVFGKVDFDDAERYMVFTTVGTVGSDPQRYSNCISLADLSTFPPVVRNLNDYGRGSISADGRYIMVSGAGIDDDVITSDPITLPRASVYERATDSLIWRVRGDFGSTPIDFVQHQWAKDAGSLFIALRSTTAPPDWGSRGVFYRVGDSLPFARPCDTCYYNGNYTATSYGTVGTPDLRVTFANAFALGGLVAYSMTPTTSVEDAPMGSSVVYPNPSTGEVRMRCASPQIAIRWGLASVTGQEIARGALTAQDAQPTDGAYVIRLGTDLPHGTYFLTLYGEHGTALCTQNVGRQ
jgi:hypothetical protein